MFVVTDIEQGIPVLSPESHKEYEEKKVHEGPVNVESIEQVEGKLQAFQDRLIQYGKDMFGEDFTIMALSETNQDVPAQKYSLDRPLRADELSHSSSVIKKKEKRDKKARENAKSVLMRFLEDREELVKLRVINKAAQERLQDRIGHMESTMKRLYTMMHESEKRKKTELLNTRAFLTELRKKLTSVERRQSRLLALMTMPDNEHRDAVLERHTTIEKRETKIDSTCEDEDRGGRKTSQESNSRAPTLEDTLSQLSRELKEIENSMKKTFGDQHESSL